jgi:DNA-binding CsgD family transcriptional regulator
MNFPPRYSNQMPWSIPKNQKASFSKKKLEDTLSAFNLVGENNYFFVDFVSKQLIMTSFLGLTTATGISKSVVEKHNHKIYSKVMTLREQKWTYQVYEAFVKNVFSRYPLQRRKDLMLFIDHTLQTTSGQKITLLHKTIPYQLDKNGNMWLALVCAMKMDVKQNLHRAIAIDIKTGDQYNFVKGKFQLSTSKVLDQEDTKVLKWIAEDMTTEQICLYLDISESTLKRKKRKIYEQLGVTTSGAAIYKAVQMGLI